MPANVFNPLSQLETLLRHEVEFVVVGGLSAVLQGVPIVTSDLNAVLPILRSAAERQ